MKMRAAEITIPTAMVRQLVNNQFPRWADLPLVSVLSSGTDNARFRLGDATVVRLPRIRRAVEAVLRDQAWLAMIGRHLSTVKVPTPMELGDPSADYRHNWSVDDWLDGDLAREGHVQNVAHLVREIAAFPDVLRKMPVKDAPATGRSLPALRARMRATVIAAAGLVDSNAVPRVWDHALAQGNWAVPLVWLHGDLAPGNLLLQGGHLTGVIDFSALGLGDPSQDLRMAWNLHPASARADFAPKIQVDAPTILPACRRALAQAMFQFPYDHISNRVLAAQARNVIAEVPAEPPGGMI